MTRAPWVLPKPGRSFPAADVTAVSTTLGWRLVNERMPARWTTSLGECNEQLAESTGISRQRQDAFAVRSHGLAAAAWSDGFYEDLVTPVPGSRSPGTRASATTRPPSGWRRCAPRSARTAAAPSRRATPRRSPTVPRRLFSGQQPPPSDSAARRSPGSLGGVPRVRAPPLRSGADRRGSRGTAPGGDRLVAGRCGGAQRGVRRPVPGLRGHLAANGLRDRDLVNAKGGAIAIGHPLGASGGRVLATLAARLRESGERYGVAALCIGVGQGLAVVLENVDTQERAA